MKVSFDLSPGERLSMSLDQTAVPSRGLMGTMTIGVRPVWSSSFLNVPCGPQPACKIQAAGSLHQT